MRRSNCAGAMQYVPELTWILFLRILDEREEIEMEESRAVGADFKPSLEAPFRWRDWAAPESKERSRLTQSTTNAFYDFINTRLIPHLKGLRDKPNANPRQKVISEIMSGVDRTRIDTCDLWCVVSLPAGVFTATGAGVKTNLLFFTKGKPTKRIWYYDQSDVKVGKKTPFSRSQLSDFFKLLPKRGDSERSWSVDIAKRRKKSKSDADAIRATTAGPKALVSAARAVMAELKKAKKSAKRQNVLKEQIKEHERTIREIESKADAIESAAFDLKAVNPNAKSNEDARSPADLLAFIADRSRRVSEIIERLSAI